MELIKDENDVYDAEQRSNATAELNNLQLVHGSDFPKTLRAFFKRMATKTFSGNNWEFGLSKLQFHLNEHEDVRERRGPLRLSKEAKNIASNPNSARVRRIRGAPGSGKSLGLASRAARLTLDGKSVLLLSYNITMANYLADLTSWARRHETADIMDEHEVQVARAHAKSRVTTVHFHGFLGGVVSPPTQKGGQAGIDEPNDGFWELWVQRAIERYSKNSVGPYGESLPRYDAILIDEGQDFKKSWWRLLHDHVLHDKGEIAIVCDRAQSLYDVPDWISEQSEFRGWTELKESFRLPKDVLRPVSRVLAELKKQGGGQNSEYIEPQLPEERQEGLWSPSQVEWNNTTDTSNAPSLKDWISDVLEKVRADAVTTKLSAPDIVFLADTHEDGEQLVEAAIRDTGTQFQSVFDSKDKRRQQERKRSFWPGAGGYRFCTVHSFKGWESRVVIYLISERSTIEQLYVALTRLRGEPEGIPARLFVRNGKPEFNYFGDLVMSSN
jgi:superfamily I DNA/RNA helicase